MGLMKNLMGGIEMDTPLFISEDFRHLNSKGIDLSGPFGYADRDDSVSYDDEEFKGECRSYVDQALLLENRPAFVEFINYLPLDYLATEFESIIESMHLWDAGICAAAAFDGDTKLTEIPAWTAWTSQVDNGPLHKAAERGAFKMATLLLQRGYSADVRADYDTLKAVLPLDVILSQIRDFTRAPLSHCPTGKPVNLVLLLCEQEGHMRMMLETLRVIAQNTRDIKRVFFNYLKNGMMVEVGALLMVARSRVLYSSTGEGKFRRISEMHDFVLNAKCQLSSTETDKLVDMEETLVLLKIFGKIGQKLAGLLRVDLTAFPVGDRCSSSVVAEDFLQAAGFDVKPKLTCNEAAGILARPSPSRSGNNKSTRFDMYLDDTTPLFVDEHFRYLDSKDYDLSGPLLFVDPSLNEKDICGSNDKNFEAKWISYIEQAVLLENTTAFVQLINNLPLDFLNKMFTSIEGLMSRSDGGKCAAAVFDGKTKLTRTPAWTAWASQVNNGPLHGAAASGNFKMATVLLQRGFSADVRADYEKFKAVLPLDVNLSQIRYFTGAPLSLWPKGQKAVQLVLLLCGEEMHMPRMLETLRVIAQNTRDIKRVFFNYLKDGMMVEVAALLLVARSRVLSSSRSEGEFQSISEMHDFVINEKCQLSPTAIDKFIDMEETLVLLEIFDKIGNKLAALLRVDLSAFPIGGHRCLSVIAGCLMQAAEFDVKPKLTCNEDVLPMRVKEAASRGLGDKSGNTSCLPFSRVVKSPPCTRRMVRGLSTVSVSPLSSPGTVPLPPLSSTGTVPLPPLSSTGSVPVPVTMELLQHLVKNRASILGTMRRLSRFR